jgi:hypothetical protein
MDRQQVEFSVHVSEKEVLGRGKWPIIILFQHEWVRARKSQWPDGPIIIDKASNGRKGER